MPRNVWLDCDPGHDDAVALLLALELPEINLLGVSTVNGNSSLENTTRNAATLLAYFRAPPETELHRGAARPTGVEHFDEKAAKAIHGASGLDGVELLPPLPHPAVQNFYTKTSAGTDTAVKAMASAIRKVWNSGKGEKTFVVVTGPCTNAAKLIHKEEVLVKEAVAGWVVMGGAFGISQWTETSEFNIHTDPTSFSALLRPPPFPPVILDPLNITHTAIFDEHTHRRLLYPDGGDDKEGDEWCKRRESDVRWMLSTLLTFFAKTYDEVFGFKTGPPLHDALCIAWLAQPSLFTGRWGQIEVGCHEADTGAPEGEPQRGETRLIPGTEWASEEGIQWDGSDAGLEGRGKKGNVFSLEDLDNAGFWSMFLDCVKSVESKIAASPLD